METLEVGGRSVGAGQPCFIIAEAGVNHNGDAGLAHALVDVAVDAGADAVKFQTFSAERLVASEAPKAEYQRQHTPAGETQFEMLKKLELSEALHGELIAHCRERGVLFLSTPFDEESADFLEGLDMCAYKIPSGEITNLPFLAHVAHKRRPMIVSTGMATLAEVQTALQTIDATGHEGVMLLHCVTNYPADPSDCNLRAMHTMAAAFKVPVGWSDHTSGIEVSLAAVALGACVIEKHFTLDRTLPGPDQLASLVPEELRALVESVRLVQSSLGNGVKRPMESESKNLSIGRKSLHWRGPLCEGASVRAQDLVALRPGTGVSPARLHSLINRRMIRDVCAGEMVREDDLEPIK